MLYPIQRFIFGFKTYFRGLRWTWQNPRYGMLLFFPIISALAMIPFMWEFFRTHHDTTFLNYLLFVVVTFMSVILIVNILAAPIYEWISYIVEEQISGKMASEKFNFWKSLRLIFVELKKIFFIFLISTICLFIPIINVVSILVTAWLLAWDYYDYPLARRGLNFRDRLKIILSDGWAVMGFGIVLCIPLLQIFLSPIAVVGGTMLAIEKIKEIK